MPKRAELLRCLQGFISVYKPPNENVDRFRRRIASKLAYEFNKLPWEKERTRTFVLPPQGIDVRPTIREAVDIVDNPLVIGKRFVLGDFLLNPIDPLTDFSSGVQVFGIGESGAYTYADSLYQCGCMKSYQLTGLFGRASSDGLSTGSTLYKTNWRHITRPKLDRVLASLEFKARSAAVLHAGLLPNTQKAYLTLSKTAPTNAPQPSPAPLRPIMEPSELLQPTQIAPYWDRVPVRRISPLLQAKPDPSSVEQLPPSINAVRCIDFSPPFFTIEIQVIHETDEFLTDLMMNIGSALRSSCLLSKARRLRHGVFHARDCLLLKHCTVPPELYDAFLRLRSTPPQDSQEFDGVEDYRQFVVSEIAKVQLPPSLSPNIFSNLFQSTQLYKSFGYLKSAK